MQEPLLEHFDLTEELILKARQSRDREERATGFLSFGWIVFWIVLGILWSADHASEHFGPVQWAASGFFFGIITLVLFIELILPFLLPRCFPFYHFYSPILVRYSNFQGRRKEYEAWKERERIRLWREGEAIKKRESDYWLGLDGWAFEHELARLLRRLGWQTTVTAGSDDKGIDIYLIRDGSRLAIQCKAHKNPVGPSVVRELVGASAAAKCDGAILVALGGITSGARDLAVQQSIEVWTISEVLRFQNEVEDKASAD